METLLVLVLRDRHVEKYIFSSLKDVKTMLRDLHFYVDRINAHLLHVKSHIFVSYMEEIPKTLLAEVLKFWKVCPLQIMSSEERWWLAGNEQ